MDFTRGISEIVLIVKAAADFYRNVVGLVPEREADEKWAGVPGQTQRIALAKAPLLFEDKSPFPEGKRWGKIHFAFKLPREKLKEAIAHIRNKGVEVYGPTHFEWMKAKSHYFYDLDGNLLEFWSPDPK